VQQKYIEITKVQSDALSVQDARILTRAAPPLGKSLKKSFLALAGGVIMGILLGAGTSLATELYTAGFRSSDQVKQTTGYYCANIVSSDLGKRNNKPAKYGPLEHVINAPFSRFTEGFRQVKALALQSKRLYGDKVLCIASSVAGEGKTLVAGNLATLLSNSNAQKTLLIDCDLHRRSLTRQLLPDAKEGIIEALADPAKLAELVTVMPGSGVHVLPCVMSERSAFSADWLGSPQMSELLKLARDAYDFIIIDAPPIMPVVDVRMLERFVDRFVFVIQWNATSRRVVLESLGESVVVQDRMLCVVLNNIDRDALPYIEAYKGPRVNEYYEN
jgi:succinoglycan biosynthesis transport protein ExoP